MERERLRELERENARLRMERELLKRAVVDDHRNYPLSISEIPHLVTANTGR